ncbi:hypothetical protein [Nocardia sp. CY41]|uniref:hypothetical protein n=1 Tax=Nocardia sp. CY41 TaxID=2608686 RepID=UPI0013577A70|nr:hypothetical protein [Nocardia sp. CY41]
MPVRPDDPTGSYFYSWGVPTPPGEWNYRLDEFVHYGPGWWPFYTFFPASRDTPEGLLQSGVRICPDTEKRAWGSETVLLWPNRHSDPAIATATLHLCVRPQGLGVIAVDTKLTIDLRAKTFCVSPNCPQPVREQAETKAARILRFVQHHRSRRRAGKKNSDTE